MQIVTTEFPFVWLRYTGSTHTDPARLIAELDALLARREPFVLLTDDAPSGDDRGGDDHELRKQLAKWSKASRAQSREWIPAMIAIGRRSAARGAQRILGCVREGMGLSAERGSHPRRRARAGAAAARRTGARRRGGERLKPRCRADGAAFLDTHARRASAPRHAANMQGCPVDNPIRAMRIFTRIVEMNSFTRAAQALGISRATATRTVQEPKRRSACRCWCAPRARCGRRPKATRTTGAVCASRRTSTNSKPAFAAPRCVRAGRCASSCRRRSRTRSCCRRSARFMRGIPIWC